MTLQIFLQIFSSQVCNILPIPRSAASRPREQSRHPHITASRSSGRVRPRERTSSSTPSAASPVVAHLRRALCGSRPDSPCVLAALIRMGLLKIARLQRADIASSPPHRHHHRTHRRRATALCHNPARGAQQSVPGLDTPPAVGVPEVRHYRQHPDPAPA